MFWQRFEDCYDGALCMACDGKLKENLKENPSRPFMSQIIQMCIKKLLWRKIWRSKSFHGHFHGNKLQHTSRIYMSKAKLNHSHVPAPVRSANRNCKTSRRQFNETIVWCCSEHARSFPRAWEPKVIFLALPTVPPIAFHISCIKHFHGNSIKRYNYNLASSDKISA